MNKAMPPDENFKPYPLAPSAKAVASVDDATVTVSELITLPTGSTIIEVAALSYPVLLSWGSRGSVTNSTADAVIQAGMIRHLVVPTGETTVYIKSYDGTSTAQCVVIGWN